MFISKLFPYERQILVIGFIILIALLLLISLTSCGKESDDNQNSSKDGVVVKETDYDENGDVSFICEYKYDKGKLIRKELIIYLSAAVKRDAYKYGFYAGPTACIEYYNYQEGCNYPSSSNTKYVIKDSDRDDLVDYDCSFLYDEDGNMLSKKEPDFTTTWEYDENGNCIYNCMDTGSGTKTEDEYTYKFDEDGHLISRNVDSCGYNSWKYLGSLSYVDTEYYYDENGRLEKINSYDKNGNIESISYYEYDSEGNYTITTDYSSGSRYVKEYCVQDDFSNIDETSELDKLLESDESGMLNALDNSEAEKALREFAPYAIENVTKAMIVYLGEEKVPILITDGGVGHIDGFIHMFAFCNSKIEEICSNDWFEKIYLDTGLVQSCYMGGGFGETHSTYYLLIYDTDSKYTSSSILCFDSVFVEKNYPSGTNTEEDKEEFYRLKEEHGDHYYLGGNLGVDDYSDQEVSKSEFYSYLSKWQKGKRVLTREDIEKGLVSIYSNEFQV